MDMNPAIVVVVVIIIVIRASGYPIFAVAIVTKLRNQWIKSYMYNNLGVIMK